MERYHATSVLSLTARHPARAGQRSAALSTPQASPSDDREEHEMEWVPARDVGSGQLGQRAAERLGRSAGKPEMF